MKDVQRKMILDWMRKIHQLEYAHRFESLKWEKRRFITGILAFSISTIIAFSFRFPKVEPILFDQLPLIIHHNYFVAIASFVVAILTGYQTFTKPNEKALTHKNTGSSYEKLRHRIEFVLTSEFSDWELNKRIEMIKEEWEGLDAINVSEKYFNEGKKKVKSFKKYPKELDFLQDVEE